MNEPLPLISVIIPAHNSAATVGTAIESMLDQTYSNLEIIVVDDNSTDGTFEGAKAYERKDARVRAYPLPYDDPRRVNARGRNVNAGYMARNYGLKKARGEWITFQDADDVSLVNRIEAEYILARRYEALHVCVEWQQLTDDRIGKSFDFEAALREHPEAVIGSAAIVALARRTRGIVIALLGPLRRYVPWRIKTMRVVNKLFFGSLDSYPGSGNSPLFHRSVTDRVRFRPVNERVWPSFTGRGADRDFNFQVAVIFGQSVTAKIPLYLWRVRSENDLGYDFGKYLLE